MGLISEFKEFAMKGNVVDMAVGVVIGGAFGKVVSALVEKIIMPAVGMFGGVDFSKYDVELVPKTETEEAVTLGVGSFGTTIIDFLIVAFAIFMAIKLMNSVRKRFEDEAEEEAPAAPPEDIVLLREIRDSLRQN